MPTCTFCNQSISAKSTKCPKCGAALFEDRAAPSAGRASSGTDGDVVSMLEQGRKGDAVRIYREQTGAGLRAANDAIDAIQRVEETPTARTYVASSSVDADLKADLWALMQNGQKTEAIRLYRERTGCSLRTASEIVEGVSQEHGVVPGGARAGCLGVLVLCLAVPGLVASLFT
jgi:ribosomal protein L7/L12